METKTRYFWVESVVIQIFAIVVNIFTAASVQDDFELELPDETLKEEQEDTKVATIAFVRKKDTQSEDVKEEAPWESCGQKKETEFVLYTEDEYKKLKK